MADAVEQALRALEEQERELAARLARVQTAIAAIRGVMAAPSAPAARAAVIMRNAPAGQPVSWAIEVERVLRDAGQPLYVRDILKRLQERGIPTDQSKHVRDTVSGIVGRKARKGEVFTHVGPGTFGLIEWGNGHPAKHAANGMVG